MSCWICQIQFEIFKLEILVYIYAANFHFFNTFKISTKLELLTISLLFFVAQMYQFIPLELKILRG